jgi:hypothetical protein
MEELGRVSDFIDITETREEPVCKFSPLIVGHAGEGRTGGALYMSGQSLWSF